MSGIGVVPPLALFAVALVVGTLACDSAPTPTPIRQVRTAPKPFPLLGEQAAPHEAKVDKKTGFIIADGYVTVAQQCTICHSAKLVTQNRGDRAHWKSLIVWMQETQGLWSFSPEQEETILSYLATNYGAKESGRRPLLDDALMPPPPAADSPKLAQAQDALTTLGGRLQAALKGALPQGAPQAVDACHVIAPKSAPDGPTLRAGRTSRRLRNAKNVAPDWVEPLYQSYERGTTVPELTVALDDAKGVGVVRPIRMKPMCLKCHGAALADGVQSKLDALYPHDAATGYAAGELRGVFWAEAR